MKPTYIRARLHEQREFPRKELSIALKKGNIIEEGSWDKKTEEVKIFFRYYLKNFKWLKTNDKKFDYLKIVFKKDNLKQSNQRKIAMAKKIVEKNYKTMAYSFFNSLFDSTVAKCEFSDMEVKKCVEAIVELINKKAKKGVSIYARRKI